MRAGRLDRLIDIQRATKTYTLSGEPILAWENLSARLAASVVPLQGTERFSDPQIKAHEQFEFRIRFSTTVDDLSPLDRIIYPALAFASPTGTPNNRDIYDIIAVDEIGRKEGLRIIATRRPDEQ